MLAELNSYGKPKQEERVYSLDLKKEYFADFSTSDWWKMVPWHNHSFSLESILSTQADVYTLNFFLQNYHLTISRTAV